MIKKILHKFSLVILILLVLLLAVTSFYFYKKSKVQTTAASEAASQAEVMKLVDEVGKLILLPVGETPTIATVTDPSALKDQAFFVQAQTGDKVLIYSNAKKAILYRPDINKIIEVAPVNIKPTQATSTPTTSTTTPKTTVKSVKK